jgi:butyryl-CoA dehydrogenase
VIAWLWLRQAMAARTGKVQGKPKDDAFYQGKLNACRYFFIYELPKIDALLHPVMSLDDTCYSAQAEQFIGI